MTEAHQMDNIMQSKHNLVDEALAQIMHVGTVEAMKWAVKAAKAEEREACAQILDEMADDMVREMEPSTAIAYVRSKAAAIRARGETK